MKRSASIALVFLGSMGLMWGADEAVNSLDRYAGSSTQPWGYHSSSSSHWWGHSSSYWNSGSGSSSSFGTSSSHGTSRGGFGSSAHGGGGT